MVLRPKVPNRSQVAYSIRVFADGFEDETTKGPMSTRVRPPAKHDAFAFLLDLPTGAKCHDAIISILT
jgi:hypothetical protein